MLTSATRIVGLYTGLATAWVVGSDRVLDAAGLGEVVLIQNVKGTAFVLFTALALWGFLRQEFQRRTRSEDALRSTLERLAQSEADLRSVIEKLPDAFFRTDLDGRVSMASPQFAREFGLTPETVIGTRIADHYVEEDGRAKFLTALKESGGEVRDHRMPMRRQDGSTFWISANAYIRRDPAGRPIGVEGIARNTTAQHHLEERLRYLAGHDALTGLCNRIRFEDRLEHAIARARREDTSFALLFLDLDGFKEVNDTHGHQKGDEVLVTTAQRLSAALRNSDTTARIGGDEFAVLLEGDISVENARAVAEKVIDSIDRPIAGLDLSVSASVGMAFFPSDGADAGVLLRCADQAMYRAKRLGKNRLELGTA